MISEERCLHHLLENQVEKTPNAVALVDGDRQWTYRELDQRANQVAHYLASNGVEKEVPVGIYLDRSFELVVTIWGVFKAGGIYVPLDIAHPRSRLQHIIEDTGMPFVISDSDRSAELPPNAKILNLEEDSSSIERCSPNPIRTAVTPDSLAYIVYTSGSTGKPKGVMIPHRVFSRCLYFAEEVLGFTGEDRFLLNFFRAPEELLFPLFVGATLVLSPRDAERDMALLGKTISSHRINVIGLTPTLLKAFLAEADRDKVGCLRHVFCAGEPLTTEVQRLFFDRLDADLYNFYGLAEAPYSSLWKCSRNDSRPSVPIGQPVDATIHLLDENLDPVENGATGEIYVGGPGLARGYLNLPNLTAERFLIREGSRLYRTGDRARIDDKGQLILLGRSDHQVQVRGLRVELEDIETCLLPFATVRDVVVDYGNEKLVAYLALEPDAGFSATHSHADLASQLPDYMLPSAFVLLDELPRTTTGKIDRKNLPPPEKKVVTDLRSSHQPENHPQKAPTGWCGSDTAYPRESCVHQLFEVEAARSADAVAVVFEDREVTYRELNEKANQLAHYLIEQGLQPHDTVAIFVERSPELIIGLLAILKAGGNYLPLEPGNPPERLGYMLDDAGVDRILTQQSLEKHLPDHHSQRVLLSSEWAYFKSYPVENPECRSESLDLAYINYTSGSTGRPKGVCIPHRGVVRLVRGADYFPFSSQRVFLQNSSVAFDAATFEIWGALLNGARLVIAPPGIVAPPVLVDLVRRHDVDTLWLTASLFNLIVDEGRIGGLETINYLLVGGETLSPRHVRQALEELKSTQLINGYGPTENTTFTCCYPIEKSFQEPSVPIGRPIANTQVHVFDEQLQPVAVGEPGELCIAGDGLAQGYLNDPELTARQFVELPGTQLGLRDDSPVRLYRSGDSVRWRNDGNIEFIGRMDHQLKLRGHRVEPREIEETLRRNPRIRDAAVVASTRGNSGDQRLIGYVVPDSEAGVDSSSDTPGFREALRQWMRDELPEYMVPSKLVTLESLPLNANGKLDRNALPDPGDGGMGVRIDHVNPRTNLEERLAAIWRSVLDFDDVGIHDDFFALGGHSLLGLHLLNEVEKEFGIRWPVRTLLECPTVAQWAKLQAPWKEASTSESEDPIVVKLNHGNEGTPVFLLPGGMGTENELMVFASLARHFELGNPIYGVRAPLETFTDRRKVSMSQLASSYIKEFRKIQPKGPCLVCGECLAGALAYEVARQLRKAGEGVIQLILLDAICPPRHDRRQFRKTGYQQLELDHGEEMASQVFPYYLALHNHVPKKFDGDITLLATNTTIETVDETLGWERRATGKLRVIRLPGDHESYLRTDAETTGRLLGQLIEETLNPLQGA